MTTLLCATLLWVGLGMVATRVTARHMVAAFVMSAGIAALFYTFFGLL